MSRVPLLLFAGFTFFLLSVVGLKNLDQADGFFAFFGQVPYHDKIGHFLLMGILGGLAVAALAPRIPGSRVRATGMVLAVVALLITLEEISQAWVSSRTFSLADLGCSLAGAVVFGLIASHFLSNPDTRDPVSREDSEGG